MQKIKTAYLLIALAAILIAGCDDTVSPSNDTPIPLAAPEAPSLTPRNERIEVAFTTAATATGYELWYGTSDNPGGAKKWPEAPEEAGRLVSATITGLSNGITYWVWSKAIYPYGTSPFSEGESAMPIPPPATPASPMVSASDTGQLEVHWSEVSGAESYVIYYSTSGGATPPADSARQEGFGTSALIKSLNDTSYTLWLAAKNTADESAPSGPASATVAAAGSAPSAILSSPRLAYGDKRLTVSWDGVSKASSYYIYYNTSGSTPTETDRWTQEITAELPTVSARLTGLTNGTSYFVWVTAKNSAGVSGLSASNNETPQAKPTLSMSNINFVVGTAAAAFSAGGDRGWRKKETSIGNLFADSAAWYMRQKYPGDPVDFALLPARIVRGGHPKGTMTVRSITQLLNTASYSYNWSLTCITLTGSQVIELFATAADVSHSGGGGHPTGAWHLISKEVHHTIDYTTGSDNTHGVTKELIINGDVLKTNYTPTSNSALLNKTYRIVTMQYLIDGVDDYTYRDRVYNAAANIVQTGISTKEAIAYYIYDFDEPVQPVIDGRIALIGGVIIP